jgi:hypothetical protein
MAVECPVAGSVWTTQLVRGEALQQSASVTSVIRVTTQTALRSYSLIMAGIINNLITN